MATQHYNIGLDFGTYQSKACILHVDAEPSKHEFFQFIDLEGNNTYFLPSRVYLMENNTFKYGFKPSDEVLRTFNFFKIAAAEDEDFQVVVGYSDKFYRKDFEQYTPETLSVLFLTFLLFQVESKFKSIDVPRKAGGGRLLGMLRRREESVEVKTTIQLGIPSEYSNSVNIKRKRKYENMLVLSKMLMEKYLDLQNFLVQETGTLIKDIQEKVDQLIDADERAKIIEDKLESYGISVFPEAAAGLTYLVKSGRLGTGFYIAMDIGGGSSDLSFFRVKEDRTIDYLAAESLMLASNNIFLEMLQDDAASLELVKQTEEEMRKELLNGKWKKNKKYTDSADKVKDSLDKKIKELFNQRILLHYRHLKTMHIREAFENQPCFMYGGGSMLPSHKDKMGILIYDSGCPSTHNAGLMSYMSKKWLKEYLPAETILPEDRSWENQIGLLIVAFGLSYLHGDRDSYWDESNYHNRELKKESYKLVPHPVNEDQYVYDVIAQKWY